MSKYGEGPSIILSAMNVSLALDMVMTAAAGIEACAQAVRATECQRDSKRIALAYREQRQCVMLVVAVCERWSAVRSALDRFAANAALPRHRYFAAAPAAKAAARLTAACVFALRTSLCGGVQGCGRCGALLQALLQLIRFAQTSSPDVASSDVDETKSSVLDADAAGRAALHSFCDSGGVETSLSLLELTSNVDDGDGGRSDGTSMPLARVVPTALALLAEAANSGAGADAFAKVGASPASTGVGKVVALLPSHWSLRMLTELCKRSTRCRECLCTAPLVTEATTLLHAALLPPTAAVRESGWAVSTIARELLADCGRSCAALALCAALGANARFNFELGSVASNHSVTSSVPPHWSPDEEVDVSGRASMLLSGAHSQKPHSGAHNLAELLAHASTLTHVSGYATSAVMLLQRAAQRAVEALASRPGVLKRELEKAFSSSTG